MVVVRPYMVKIDSEYHLSPPLSAPLQAVVLCLAIYVAFGTGCVWRPLSVARWLVCHWGGGGGGGGANTLIAAPPPPPPHTHTHNSVRISYTIIYAAASVGSGAEATICMGEWLKQ